MMNLKQPPNPSDLGVYDDPGYYTSEEGRAIIEEWSKVIAYAWVEPNFRLLLASDPAAALQQYNTQYPGQIDTLLSRGIVFPIPPPPMGLGEAGEFEFNPGSGDIDTLDTGVVPANVATQFASQTPAITALPLTAEVLERGLRWRVTGTPAGSNAQQYFIVKRVNDSGNPILEVYPEDPIIDDSDAAPRPSPREVKLRKIVQMSGIFGMCRYC